MSCFYIHSYKSSWIWWKKSDCFCLEPFIDSRCVRRMSSKFLALDVFGDMLQMTWISLYAIELSLISLNQAARTLRSNDFCLKSRTAWRVVARHWELEMELRANWLFALTGSVWGRGRRWRPPTGPYLGAGRTNPSAPAGRFPSRACIHPSRRYR